jgi:hypothetical protein
MIHTEAIELIINIALHTAYVKGDKPQSLLIVSEVENGKTKLVSQFRNNPSIVFPHDATAFGIVRDYLPDLESGKLKHLIFPEFIQPLSRNRDTVKTFITFLNGLVEDGITDISTYNTELHLEKPVYAGVIACLATAEFKEHKKTWASSGFLSRFLPVTYSYSEASAKDIFEAIYQGRLEMNDYTINAKETEVELPVEIARALNPAATDIARNVETNTKIKGYRAQIQLQRMIKGLAIMAGRSVVTQNDLDDMKKLANYINLNFNEL